MNDQGEHIKYRTVTCPKCERSWQVRVFTEHCYCDCDHEFTVEPIAVSTGRKWSPKRRAAYKKQLAEKRAVKGTQ